MIEKFIINSQFNPKRTSIFFQPFYFARRGLYEAIKDFAPYIKGRILDVGCGQKPYKDLFEFTEYIGMDVKQEGHPHLDEDVDVFYDGKIFPFDAECFDSVITTQVFEHVFTPEDFLQQINRVLKPEGKLLLTVPFVWDEHEQPFDFARYSSFGIKHILRENGFEIVQYRKTFSDIRVIFQLINAYIYKVAFQRGKLLKYVSAIFLIGPNNILGSLLYKILPSNNDLYLDNIVLAVKKANH